MTTLFTVFGGTGFLGGRIARRLAQQGATVRVAVRHPERAIAIVMPAASGRIVPLRADIREAATLAPAIAGAAAVVNATSAYVETGRGDVSFRACGGGAERRRGMPARGRRLPRAYLRHRGRRRVALALHPGARARRAGRAASVSRSDDPPPERHVRRRGFVLQSLAAIIRSSPVVPLIAGGGTRLQPIHADNVAEAVRAYASATLPRAAGHTSWEVPESCALREIAEMLAARLGRRRVLVPLPTMLAHPLARLLEFCPARRSPPPRSICSSTTTCRRRASAARGNSASNRGASRIPSPASAPSIEEGQD